MVTWDRSASWQELLRRALQSLRDTAPRLSRTDDSVGAWCQECAGDGLLGLADRCSGQVERLPHWLVHSLGALLVELRIELTWAMLGRPFGDGVVGDRLRGLGERSRDTWTAEERTAERVSRDHHRLVELWLGEEVRMLAPWVARILAAGRRLPSGVVVSAAYVERSVVAAVDVVWRDACRAWSDRLGTAEDPGVSSHPLPAMPAAIEWPEWLAADERALLWHCLGVEIERRVEQRGRALARRLSRIDDPEDRRRELLVVDAECAQYRIELHDEALRQAEEHGADLAVVLAAAAHDAASRRRGG